MTHGWRKGRREATLSLFWAIDKQWIISPRDITRVSRTERLFKQIKSIYRLLRYTYEKRGTNYYIHANYLYMFCDRIYLHIYIYICTIYMYIYICIYIKYIHIHIHIFTINLMCVRKWERKRENKRVWYMRERMYNKSEDWQIYM